MVIVAQNVRENRVDRNVPVRTSPIRAVATVGRSTCRIKVIIRSNRLRVTLLTNETRRTTLGDDQIVFYGRGIVGSDKHFARLTATLAIGVIACYGVADHRERLLQIRTVAAISINQILNNLTIPAGN